MAKLIIYQGKIAKNKQDSFWYEGLIARIGEWKLIATGDMRITFPKEKEYHSNYHAVKEVENKGYTDKDLEKSVWDNNNWLEIFKGNSGDFGEIEYYYDDAVKKLKELAKEGL